MRITFKTLFVSLCCLAVLSSWSVGQDAPYTLKVAVDKPEAIYQKGEKITFRVTLLDDEQNPVPGKEISLTIAPEGTLCFGWRALKEPEKSVILTRRTPVAVETSMDRPGFVLCTATFEYAPKKTVTGQAGVGVAPLEIKAAVLRPDDFQEFWRQQKEALAKIPMNPVLTPMPAIAGLEGQVETFDVKVDCLGEMPVRGYYSRPAHAAPKSLPALITLHGSGVRSAYRPDKDALPLPDRNAIRGMIAMDINAHGIENGQPAEYYQEVTKSRLSRYRREGCDDPDKIYFRGMFLRVVRALEFLKAQPEWDGKTLIVWGSSQGGTQAFVAAALDPDVSLCIALMPGLSNLSGQLAGMNGPWPGFLRCRPDGTPEDPNVAKTIPYYDMANFAPEIKARTYMSAGLLDDICPPSSVYAAYNNLTCEKEIINYSMRHGGRGSEPVQKLEEYLKAVKEGKTP